MGARRFKWDDQKNAENRRKHGVSFDEAETVCFDEGALLINDPDHSKGEDRFILLGLSAMARPLVVVHCCRAKGDSVRIISARKVNRAEREE